MGSPDFAQKVKEGNHVRISVLLAQNLTKFLQQFYWRWPQQKPPLFWLLPTSSFLSARSLVPIQWTLWSALQTSLLLWLLTSHQFWRDMQNISPHETHAHHSQRGVLFPNIGGRVKEGISYEMLSSYVAWSYIPCTNATPSSTCPLLLPTFSLLPEAVVEAEVQVLPAAPKADSPPRHSWQQNLGGPARYSITIQMPWWRWLKTVEKSRSVKVYHQWFKCHDPSKWFIRKAITSCKY